MEFYKKYYNRYQDKSHIIKNECYIFADEIVPTKKLFCHSSRTSRIETIKLINILKTNYLAYLPTDCSKTQRSQLASQFAHSSTSASPQKQKSWRCRELNPVPLEC